MTSISKGLKSNTTVFGLFEETDIAFAVGDCQRVMDCIKVHNMRKIDEEHTKEVPATLCISDSRLALVSHTKAEICAYFNAPATPKNQVRTTKKLEKKIVRRVQAMHH